MHHIGKWLGIQAHREYGDGQHSKNPELARAGIGEAWSEPSQQWLENINQTEHESSDAFLTEDGLELYFASDRSGNPDIYRARRGALDQPFAEPEPLDIDTAAEERDPWLSPDKNTLYFSSNRGPERRLAVYRAQRR